MKPPGIWLCPLFMLASIGVVCNKAGTIVDQEFVTNLRAARQAASNYFVGQTFTAGRTGQLKRIQIDMNADLGLRNDLKGVLINNRSGIRKPFTAPFWKIPRSTQHSLAGIDVSSLSFNVVTGDSCTIAFNIDSPWGFRPTVSFLSGCWGPEGVHLCSEPEAVHYTNGATVAGDSLSALTQLDDDIAIRTFVSGSFASAGAPILYEQPEDIDSWLGDPVWIPSFAVGAEPITYQWFKDGQPMTAVNSAEITYGVATTNLNGSYYVVASNSFGSATSRVSTVVIHTKPLVYGWSKISKAAGSTFDITVDAYGKGSLRYEWFFNEKLIGTSASYTVTVASVANSGTYSVKVSDDNGTTEWQTLVTIRDDGFRVKWVVDTGLPETGSPPTVAPNGRIYVSSGSGMSEFNPTGVRSKWYGIAWDGRNAPIVVGGIGLMDSGRDMFVTKFDGTFLNRSEFREIATTPAVLTNGIAFILETTNNVRAFDLIAQKTLWNRTIKTPWSSTDFAPVYDSKSGVVYVNSEYNRIWALDGTSGGLLWTYWLDSPARNDPCIGADGAFYVSSSTNIFCFEPRSGRIRWQRAAAIGWGNGMAVSFDGKLYASDWPKAVALNGYNGEVIWSVDFQDFGYQSPTLLGDLTVLYWSGSDLLTVRDARDGKFLWDYLAPSQLVGAPAVGPDGTIYFTCYDGKLYALKTAAPLLGGPWSRTRGGTMNNAVSDLSLPVLEVPVITRQPIGQLVGEGADVTIDILATGTPPLTVQWVKNGELLTGETGTSLHVGNFGQNDSGEYWAVVSNTAGATESGHARLSMVANIPVQVSTLAGSGLVGCLNGSAPLQAKFAGPDGGAVTRDGVILVGDGGNHVIRYILPNGEVGTFVGTPTVSGYREDVWTNALFNLPLGLSLDSVGDLLVADYGNHRVRKALGLGYRSSSLLAGDGTRGLRAGVRRDAELNGPNDLVQLDGRIYFTEFFNHTVRSINATGLVTVLAGSGVAGFKDGVGSQAQFSGPAGITTFGGSLYVTDGANNRVRKVTTDGVVTTIAGSGALGFKSGLGTEAELGTPNGICADEFGNLYFTEYSNSAVRRIDTNGWVSTLAGTGVQGFADGNRTQAMFNRPGGICMHPDGSLIVMDTENNRIRRIVIDGKTNGWTRSGGFLTADLHPTLKVFGNVGERYRIETRDGLGQADWSAVTSITLEQSPTIWVDERADGAMQRVYRAVRE